MLAILQTDRRVIRHILGGRTEEFGILVDRYGRLVYTVAYACLRNEHDAEDVVQETYTRLYQHLHTLGGRHRIGPWLATVSRNLSIDRLKKLKRELLVPEQAPASITQVPNPARDEMRQLVADQLSHLDNEDREILLLHYFLGKKAREIGELLEIQPAAAAKRLQRARNELGLRLVDALKDDLAGDQAPPERRRRIMAAVAVVPAAWKPSAALAVAGGVITGVSATKIITGIASGTIIGILILHGAWRCYLKVPSYKTQDVTAQSQIIREAKDAQESIVAGPAPSSAGSKIAEPQTAPSNPSTQTLQYGIVLYGIILNKDLRPIADASVTLSGPCYAPADVPPTFRTTSNKSGEFAYPAIDLPRERTGRAGFVEVTAEAGNLYGYEMVSIATGSRRLFVELVLQPSSAVTGQVVDSQMRGVAGANIVCSKSSFCVETKSGADGSFILPHVPHGTCRFAIGADGFVPLQEDHTIAGHQRLVFRMDRGNWIGGRLVAAADGRALPGVVVEAHYREFPSLNFRYGKGYYSAAATDADGKFVLSGLEPGTFVLQMKRSEGDSAPYVLEQAPTVQLNKNSPTEGVELRAVAGASVSGRILDSETGDPIEGASVELTCADWIFRAGKAKSDAGGRYMIDRLEVGDYRAVVTAPDKSELHATVSIPSLRALEGVDLMVKRYPTVRGKVVNQGGQPVAGATVVARPVKMRPLPTTSTNEVGEFVVAMPPKTAPVHVQAYGDGALSLCAGPARAGDYVTLRLAEAGRILGTVIDGRDHPLPDCLIEVASESEGGAPLLSANGVLWDADNVSLFHGVPTNTSTTGSFELDPLLAGRYTLNVYFRCCAPEYPVATARVDVVAGETAHARLRVDTDGFGAIKGTVTNGGVPARDLAVFLSPVSNSEDWVEKMFLPTDEAGQYGFEHVRPGAVKVSAGTVHGTRTETVDVAAGETKVVDIRLGEQNTGIEGTVTLDGRGTVGDGVAAAIPVVSVRPAGDPERQAVQAAEAGLGEYRLSELHEGIYIVEVRDIHRQGMLLASMTCEVKRAQMTRCDFVLQSGFVTGSVAGLHEAEKAFVAVFDLTVDVAALATMSPDLREHVVASTEVAAGEPFEFRLQPGVYLAGCVAFSDGTEPDEASIYEGIGKGHYDLIHVEVLAGQTTPADMVVKR